MAHQSFEVKNHRFFNDKKPHAENTSNKFDEQHGARQEICLNKKSSFLSFRKLLFLLV
jgi:hypothetical protein